MNTKTQTRRLTLAAVVATLLAGIGDAHAARIYVNVNNPNTNGNGTSWSEARRHLSGALDVAVAGDEIWVAAGQYLPDRSVLTPIGTGNRDTAFVMKNGVKIYGGFTGVESTLSARNPAVNLTILSGDIGVLNTVGDNSRTIVIATNMDSACVLDGFSLRSGYCSDGSSAAMDPTGMGAAIFMSASGASQSTGMTIRNCRFENNSARGGAGIGALYCSPTIEQCVFVSGYSDSRGGGIDFWTCPNPTVRDSEFRNNVAYFGGGIYANNYTGGTFERCKFIDCDSVNGGGLFFAGFSNTRVYSSLFLRNECKQLTFFQTSFDGGAVKNWCAPTLFVNCIFNSNYARGYGSAFYDAGPSGASGTLVNCTFVNNSSRDGGVVASASGHVPVLRNCFGWSNPDAGTSGTVTTASTSFMGGASPFVNAQGADGTLGTEDDDLRLFTFASAVNAGDNSLIPVGITTDFLGNTRIFGGTVDLGAIERVPPPCFGDANGDFLVNFDDITSVLSNWLGAGSVGDADHSGVVDFSDITAVLANWNGLCAL